MVLPITGLLPDSIIESIIKVRDWSRLQAYAPSLCVIGPGSKQIPPPCGVNTEALNDRYATAAYGHLLTYVQDAKRGTNHSKVPRCILAVYTCYIRQQTCLLHSTLLPSTVLYDALYAEELP
eukprot:1179280-Prorocentrum_minimum.AAC.1